MFNMSREKVPMPQQEPSIRNKNFNEVDLGYTDDMARSEAKRCLNCKSRPCVSACPVNVAIPDFIKCVADGKIKDAYKIISDTNNLPAICARVCPQESQCELKCVRGVKGEPVGIGRLERYVADWYMGNGTYKVKEIEKNGHKVAVVGSGPSGLTCAGDLAKLGYEVTVYEALHKPGGVLMYGIPEFRLPKKIVEEEINLIKDLGVRIKTDMVIGKIISIDELFGMGYAAVYIASGAGLPRFMNISGEKLVGVYSANEFLTRINLMKAHIEEYDTHITVPKKVAVIGGGNVAMDAARSAKRLGAKEVCIIYRRSKEEMPARVEEIKHAEEEGVIFKFLSSPSEILGDENGNVRAIECVRTKLSKPDETGRFRPVEIKNSEFQIDVDTVIIAIGNSPNPLIRVTTSGLKTDKCGCILIDENTMQTSRDGVFAGGDAVTGAATVIIAMGAGKLAAKAINSKIMGTS